MNKQLEVTTNINTWYNNTASIYITKADQSRNPDSVKFYDSKALFYLEESLKNALHLDKRNEIGRIYFLIGSFYLYQNKLKESEKYIKKAIEISETNGEITIRKDCYNRLSELYHKTGNTKLELEYYKKFILYRDSIFNKENTERKLRSEINFEFEKKQSIEKEKREKENLLANSDKKRQKIILWYVISFALLILLVTAFMYRSYLQKKRINNELEVKSQRIEWAHKIIAEKNHEITDSINYALHIQQAMLPDKKEISRWLPQNFILFKPKDIVSGDFYFFASNDNKLFLAAADCTGHGVPGGFMSMIGSEKLNNAVKLSSDPGKILSLLNNGIKDSLHQSEHAYTNRDGMDIALCALDLKNRTLEFAGANRPIWIIRKATGILDEIGGTKSSIGGITENNKHFDTQVIKLEEGDICYLFSDGYADQFGTNDKKLTTKKFKNLLLDMKDESLLQQGQLLEKFITDWKGYNTQTDDVLVIGVKIV